MNNYKGDHLRGDRNESHCGENGRRCTEEYIPNSYKMLVDLFLDDDVDTVDISRQGDLYSCLPACFQENVGNKCDMCLVDTANNIWCDNQEVGRGCVNRCCEYEGDASNANTRETENGRTIPSSYEMLVDLFLDDDVDTVDISRQGDLYSCLPACFQENVGNKCDMCLVDTANNIWCDDQDVGRGCVNRCCEYEGDASNANTRETENGKMIPSSYKMLVDLLLDDNADTVDISRQGNLYSCFPACFQENVGHKCDMCLVDTANNIWCDDQEVGRGCVNRCCEYQGEASSNNTKKTENGRTIPSSYEMLVDLDLDYDIDTIDINRQDELFSCLPSCFEDNVGSDCDMCLVDTANNIWCDDQEVGLECVYSCCDYIGDASDDNTEKTKNGKIIPSSYEKMLYLDNDTIVTIRQGELYSCLFGCVEENIGSKCDMCLIDTEDDIWCDNQEVDRGCIRRCCASEGSL